MKVRSVFVASFRGSSAVSAASMLILGAMRYIAPPPSSRRPSEPVEAPGRPVPVAYPWLLAARRSHGRIARGNGGVDGRAVTARGCEVRARGRGLLNQGFDGIGWGGGGHGSGCA